MKQGFWKRVATALGRAVGIRVETVPARKVANRTYHRADVEEALRDGVSVAEVCRLYDLAPSTVYRVLRDMRSKAA